MQLSRPWCTALANEPRYIFAVTDKQQELDLPTVKVEHAEPIRERSVPEKNRPMSEISGVRKLKHTNSFTGIVPKYGVETPHMEELGKVRHRRLHSKDELRRFVHTNGVVEW